MMPTGLGRLTLVLGLASTLAVPLGAQRGRNPAPGDRPAQKGDTETVTRTVPLSSTGHVHLTTFSGYVHITGTSGHDVRIKAVRRADRDVLDRVHLTIDSSSGSVTINANDRDDAHARTDDHDRIVETDFDIEMPASASLQINGFSSPLEITDVTGDERLKTFSGRITVKGAREMVDAETFNADIDVDVASAGSAPSLNAHTFSGSIRAHVAESAKASVSFKSFSGEFDSDLPLTMKTAGRGHVSGQVGSRATGDAELRFQTFSGDVRVLR